MEKKVSKNISRTPTRRFQTRRSSKGDVEARRESVNALLHHRASSSSSSLPPPASPAPWGDCSRVHHGMSTGGSVSCSWNSNHQLSSSMVEVLEQSPLPLLEPASRQPTSPPMEVPEFQWGDNQDSSYTWWLGFLKSLDDEINNEESVHPSEEEIDMEYFRQLFISLFKTDRNQIDSDNQSSAPEEWLTVPEPENHSDVSDS